MSDPWTHILKSLEPELDKLTRMVNSTPYAKPELWKNNKGKWSVTIQEIWADSHWNDSDPVGVLFDKTITWTENELKKWDCKRTSYDTWIFKSKRDAEKFITLFLLQWPN